MAWISDSKPPLAVSRSALSIYYIEREIIAKVIKLTACMPNKKAHNDTNNTSCI